MLYPDLVDVPIEVFGGYCPAIPPSDLSPGAAAIAQDVIYPLGGVRARGGLSNFFSVGSPIPANAAINGLKSYLTPTLAKRLMAWDSLGNLYKENPQGTINLLFSRPYANLFYQSSTLFGREYQAFFNSLGGFDIPRQYDDTNWDRVSQVGPGVAPSVVDDTITPVIAAGPTGATMPGTGTIASISEVGNICTVTLSFSSDFFLLAGDQVQIAGSGVVGYNGTFTVTAILGNLSFQYFNAISGLGVAGAAGSANFPLAVISFTPTSIPIPVGSQVTIGGVGVGGYNGTWPVRIANNDVLGAGAIAVVIASFTLAASGAGTVAVVGNIAAGKHQVSVSFITRQGFITPAAVPPTTWTAAGMKRANLSSIALGPSNVVARLLTFTPVIAAPATTGSFFSLPNGSSQLTGGVMLIQDNTSTTATVDFTDAILISGFSANYLFTQLELGESAFTIGYNSRMFWMGERAKVSNFINLSFDGAFNLFTNVPWGWTQTPTSSGGFQALNQDYGLAYGIAGDGATAVRGKITQGAFKDYLGVAIIQANTSYNVRVRMQKTNPSAVWAQGTVHVNMNSASGGFTTAGVAVLGSALTANFVEFDAQILTAQASIPSDLVLQVYVDGTASNGAGVNIDSIEVYPTNTPFNYSTVRCSRAFNPESYDGTTGAIQVRPSDGQQLRAGFPLRNNLYLAKDHYLCYVTDDGVNEPASWAVNEVSGTIGICGPNACDWTEEWAVFAERAGLHICWGSDPVKITPEIQIDASGTGKITWASINWAAAWTISVRIDKVNKMILVSAPVNGATTPNIVFMMDYRWLDSAEDIAGSPLVTYSSFTGKILSHGRGRRWAIWNITANSMTFAERADGTAQPFFGNGAGNGKIYQQLDCSVQASDDGVAVPWGYQGYACPSHMEEQQYQLGSHRKLLGYMKFRAVGAGLLGLAISTTQRSTLLRSYALSVSPNGDGERPINMQGERFYPTIRTNSTVGAWFQMEKWILCVKKSATIPVRGMSA